MAKNIRKITEGLGAKIGAPMSDLGGGAFGAAQVAKELSLRLAPSQDCRPEATYRSDLVRLPKVPMGEVRTGSLN